MNSLLNRDQRQIRSSVWTNTQFPIFPTMIKMIELPSSNTVSQLSFTNNRRVQFFVKNHEFRNIRNYNDFDTPYQGTYQKSFFNKQN
jgi:hypothetical protein